MKNTSLLFLIPVCLFLFSCDSPQDATENKQPEQSSPPVETTNEQPAPKPKVKRKRDLTIDDIKQLIPPEQVSDSLQIVAGENFALRKNEAATLATDSMSLFVQKIADNRCPPDVNCIRAGEVDVTLAITDNSQTHEIVLTYPTKEKPQSRDHIDMGQYRIRFLGAVKTPGLKQGSNNGGQKDKFTIRKGQELLLGFVLERLENDAE